MLSPLQFLCYTDFLLLNSSRLGRSNVGYSGSRGSLSGQDSHGMYSSRQGGYGGGEFLLFEKICGHVNCFWVTVGVYGVGLWTTVLTSFWGFTGSYDGSGVSGMYSSGYGGDYISRRNDVYFILTIIYFSGALF